jgi:hypothetical protein
MTINEIKDHIRNRSYMSGVARDQLRIRATGEVFTPTELVQEILDKHPKEIFLDKSKTICDPFCGDGQFLGEILIRKIENGIDFETALSTLYGIDIMEDNIRLCHERLLCGQKHLRSIVEKQIIVADTFKIKNWNFDGKNPYKCLNELTFDNLFEQIN